MIQNTWHVIFGNFSSKICPRNSEEKEKQNSESLPKAEKYIKTSKNIFQKSAKSQKFPNKQKTNSKYLPKAEKETKRIPNICQKSNVFLNFTDKY